MKKIDFNYDFSKTKVSSIPRSSFNRSHNHITAFDSGSLVPMYVDEVYPGDTFKMKLSALSRLSTPIAPVMDNIYIDYHYFFVPNRLLFNHWEELNGQKDKPNASTDYLVPVIKSGDKGVPVNSLFDYMGIPPKVPHLEFNSLFFRAYNKVWNDHYRDENLQDPVFEDTSDKDFVLDDKSIDNYKLLPRNKKRDYFTSALPWPQKGPNSNLNVINHIEGKGGSIALHDPLLTTLTFKDHELFHYHYRTSDPVEPSTEDRFFLYTTHDSTELNEHDPVKNINSKNVDLNIKLNDVSISVNELRQAFQLQRIFERDARVGTRYNEIVKGHFGVDIKDYRLQRSEYLGGGSSSINIQQVPQTSATDKSSPQGNMAAFGIQSAKDIGFTRSFDEHGVLLCLASVRIDNKYQYGLPRMYSRRSRFDYYLPSLAHLGEQAILNKELYATGNKDIDDKVFGYQERFSELRYNPNRVSGKLRSVADQPLDFWHLAQKFDKTPLLNSNFIQSNPPIKRALAVQNEPEIISDVYFTIECTRVMPLYSTPGGIDRF